jgi:hypothetical protein
MVVSERLVYESRDPLGAEGQRTRAAGADPAVQEDRLGGGPPLRNSPVPVIVALQVRLTTKKRFLLVTQLLARLRSLPPLSRAHTSTS